MILASLILSAVLSAPVTDSAIADRLGSDRIYVLPSGSLWSGALVRLDNWTIPALDEPLGPGTYLAVGQSVVMVGDEPIVVETRDLIYVAPIQPGDDGIEGGIGLTCSTTCGGGFYCCANFGRNGGPPICGCVKNGVSAVCESGGPGSTTCSITQP